MSPFQRGGVTLRGDMLLTTTTPLSQRTEPSPLWFGTLAKRLIRRGTSRISRVRYGKAKRGCASRVPPSPGVAARRTRGVLVEGATPPFSPLVRRGEDQRGTGVRTPFAPPCGEVAPSTVIPADCFSAFHNLLTKKGLCISRRCLPPIISTGTKRIALDPTGRQRT